MGETGQSAVYEECRDGYLLSSDPALVDIDWVCSELLDKAYWTRGRTREKQERAMANALPFGIYALDGQGNVARQVAYARLVTDYAGFGWLADVWVDEAERGKGLGKWLVRGLLNHPDVAALGRIMLTTRDAHTLYTGEAGFRPLSPVNDILVRMTRSTPTP